MKKLYHIGLILGSCLILLSGGVLSIGTLTDLNSFDQFRQLINFNYITIADSRDVGGGGSIASMFFTGLGILLFGGALLTGYDKVGKFARIGMSGIFLFLALCLIYACLHPRVGVKPF